MPDAAPEHLEFLGIMFRSYSHMVWFSGSMIFGLLGGALAVWCYRARPVIETSRLVRILLSLVMLFHICASLSATFNAYLKVYVEHASPNGPLFSLDCIWWNALMTAYYVALVVVLTRRQRSRGPTKERMLDAQEA